MLVPGLGGKLEADSSPGTSPGTSVRGDHLRSEGRSFPLRPVAVCHSTAISGTSAGMRTTLPPLIEQLGLECPAVFGVSFGGAIALELAVEHPSRLGALIVQGADSRFRSDDRLLDRSPGAGAVPLPSGQRVPESVLQPPARGQARAGTSGRLCRRANLGDRPERHGPAPGPARDFRHLRTALEDRCSHAGARRVEGCDRSGRPAEAAGPVDSRRQARSCSRAPGISAS